MTRFTGSTWSRCVCLLSVFLIGISMGVSPQSALAAPKVPPVQSLVVEYNILPFEYSENIPLVVNQPVLVMAANTGVIAAGLTQVTMLHFVNDATPPNNEGLTWLGLEPAPTPTVVFGGSVGGQGVHIANLAYSNFGFQHIVALETGPGYTIRIYNNSPLTLKGYVKLMW